MLRRGILERSPSVCTFCQYRIALRQTRIPSQRLLSTTRTLRDDGSKSFGSNSSLPGGSSLGRHGSSWGSPAFGNGPVASNSALPGVSQSSSPQASEFLKSSLLPHEIEARQRMAAQRAQAQRIANEQAAAAEPKPGQGFRNTWNPKKQREILENVRGEETSVRKFNFTKVGIRQPYDHNNPQSLDGSEYSTPPTFTDVAQSRDPPFTEKPQSRIGRGFGTPPVYTPQQKLGESHKPNFVNRGQLPFRNTERPPPRALPIQPIGSEFVKRPQPFVRKPHESPFSRSPLAASAPTSEDNEIKAPQLARIPDTNAFSKEPFKNESHISDNTSNSRATARIQSRQPTNLGGIGSTRDSIAIKERQDVTSGAGWAEDAAPNVGSSWNSLTRRQQSGNGNGQDFWSMMEKNTTPKSKTRGQPSNVDDWGKEFDKPQERPNKPQRRPQDSSWGFEERRSQPPRKRREANAPDTREITTRRKGDDTTRSEGLQLQSAPAISPDIYEYEERKSRRGVSDRSNRFEIDKGDNRKGGKNRGGGGRGSRFDDADDDNGVDYDEYLERRQRKAERKAKREAERTEPQSITLPELISISNLATALKVDKSIFLDQLAELGFEGVSLDSIMAGETAALVAQEYGFEPTVESGQEQDLKARPPPEDPSVLPPRPPVVTIMGHVDHGKTTLLDYLRKSSIAAGEHGGITQHIGAFSVSMSSGKQITFLDTPGHAAFLTMRQRGANVTDIVVLVVAADDSVKPQTLEALKHARQSKVPIIVAINKIDKDGAQIDRVKNDLYANGVEIEDYGGDVQTVCVSGKTGQGMEDLEENILTLSEILDMRAETDGQAEGWILESSLKPVGKAATILVKRGTLRPGDFIVAGTTYAKIRHLRNEAGQEIREAPPGTPVEILGWRDLPAAGDEVIQGSDERRVRQAAEYRENLREREQDAAAHEKIAEQRRQLTEQRRAEKAAEDGKYKRPDGSWGTQEQEPSDTDESGAKMVNFLVKGDVHGSVEAVCTAIQEIGSNEVRPRVLLSSPGAITESDVEHAATSNSAIVNFNLPISGLIKRQAETAGVKILDHSVIYHLTDDVRDHLASFLGVDITYKVLAEAEVLQVFPINIKGRKYKNIAGCRIRNGTVERNQLFRVLRDGEKIFEGKLESLKHGKKNIDEARKGGECGIGFEFFQDLEQGDQIQAIEEVQTKRTL